MTKLKKKVLELSYKHKLSHIGSCLDAVDIIDSIYESMRPQDKFVLSNGHAGLALYVVLEKYGFGSADTLIDRHGTHPNRDIDSGISVSTGSLGQGLPVAIGIALADRNSLVYCMFSDGELAEGSMWEALNFAGKHRLENLRLVCIGNGYGAYGKTDIELLDKRLQLFFPTLMVKTNTFEYPDFLQGLEAHYKVMTKEDYAKINS